MALRSRLGLVGVTLLCLAFAAAGSATAVTQTASAAAPAGASTAAPDPAPPAPAGAAAKSAELPQKPASAKPKPKKPRPPLPQPAPDLKPTGAASVYIFRGFGGIFSLGMDRVNAKLVQQGISSRVMSYLAWRGVMKEIVAEAARHPGNRYPLVLIGHSLGGNAALMLAYTLGQKGIPVDLVITVDPTVSRPLSSSVSKYVNLFQSGNGFGAALDADARQVNAKNVDNDDASSDEELKREGFNHFSMDQDQVVIQRIVDMVAGVVRPGSVKGPAPRAKKK